MSEEINISNLPIEIKIFRDSAIIIQPTILDSTNKIVRKVVKTIKVESLIKAFSETELDIVSPILPSSCIKYREKGNTTVITLLVEEKRFDAIAMGKEFKGCLRPNMVMVFTLSKDNENNYSIKNTQAFGLKDSPNMIGPNTQLYGLPFPNVGADGWVCWGSNSVSGTFKSLIGLKAYVERFFGSPFNNHLMHFSLLKVYGINSVEELFTSLQSCSHFPYEIMEGLGEKRDLASL